MQSSTLAAQRNGSARPPRQGAGTTQEARHDTDGEQFGAAAATTKRNGKTLGNGAMATVASQAAKIQGGNEF